MPARVHLCVYGEVDANLIDGSSVWLQSICLTLAMIPGARVTLLLRRPIERDLIIGPLQAESDIAVVEPREWLEGRSLTPERAADALTAIDKRDPIDRLVLRGAGVGAAVAGGGNFTGRIWLYHVPVGDGDEALREQAVGAHRILCQTEEIAGRVSMAVPELSDRLIALPPMIPPPGVPPERSSGPLQKIIYAGKFSPEYHFLEMVDLISRVRERLPQVELHVAGDKIHNPPGDPSFKGRAEAALEETNGLIWHGAVSREQVAELIGSSDLALSVRHPSLDESAEMSTKVLEYGALACPVVLNRTPAHIADLGAGYPYLVDDMGQALEAILAADADPTARLAAGHRVRQLSLGHGFDQVASQLAPHLTSLATGPERAPTRTADLKLLVAGHNLAFAEPLLERVRSNGAELREDLWSGHSGGDEEAGESGLDWASVVLCEWCLGNAVWYSRNIGPGQRLVVRFHRMELETAFPAEVDLEGVDTMVFVARHVLEQAREAFGWPSDSERLAVVPNAVDTRSLRRPKLPGSEFTLGMIGYVPRVKRLDMAVDMLERLRLSDDRFRLIVKGRGPWEYGWMASRVDERAYYEELFDRIERSPLLGQSVVFEPFGKDIASFLQQVGWIVSTSEIEGHSVALAEGMASGAVPVVIDRPGARSQYEERWVHEDPDSAAAAILAHIDSYAAERDAAAAFAKRWDWATVWPEWRRVLRLV